MILFPLSSRLCSRALWLSTTLATGFLVLSGCQSVATTPSNMIAATTGAPVTVSTALSTATAPAPSSLASKLTPAVQTVIGDYANDSYGSRHQGNDWVGVMVRPLGEAELAIKVRASGNIQQPSCQFDGQATLMGQDQVHGVIFQTIANNSVTFLQFKDGRLTIDSPDKAALNSFCSGGVTLAGDYQKLASELTLS